MNKLPIKINELSSIIIALIEKIQFLDSPILTEQHKVKITREMIEEVDRMRAFFAEQYTFERKEELQLFNERVERTFSQFDWNLNVAATPYQFNKFSETGKSLISSILKLLGTKGCGILLIETYLKLCLNLIAKMSEIDSSLIINLAKNKANFKLLLELILITINLFNKYWCIIFSPNQKKMIMLYFHQICKGLTLFFKAIEIQRKNMIKYALNILSQCFKRVQGEIHSNDNQPTKFFGQEFISLMNFCLYKLNEISNRANNFSNFFKKASETVSSIKPMIDEILCSVLSIAKITSNENDYTIILTDSQKVLNELNDLNKEIKEKNVYGIKLNACSLGESLCSLEHQVNTTVLRLILEVFSGINSPLKNIVNKCRTDIANNGKAAEDLNVLISEFDMEVDRIIQIGLFAASCTSNLNKILRIQSSLASLESLESELIPSVTALYLDCSLKNKVDFQYLVEFWLNEISDLKMLIDSILDLPGFCKVVQNEITQLILSLKKNMPFNICVSEGKSTLKKVVRYSKKLIRTIKTGLEDDKNEKTYEYLNDFQLVVQECETVTDLINTEETNKIAIQTVKRCDVLLNAINKLTLHLFDLVNNEELNSDSGHLAETENRFDEQIPQKNYYKLYDSVKNVTVPNDTQILTPYIEKKLLQSKQKKILSLTSTQIENLEETTTLAMHWEKSPISRKRSRCCKPLNYNLELENTIDLEITTILEKITDISKTFSQKLIYSDEDESDQGKNKTKFCKKGKDAASDTDYLKSTYKSSGCCARLDTLNQNFEYAEAEYEHTFLGNVLRNRFLEILKNLSQISSLSLSEDMEDSDKKNAFEIHDNINDLKFLEEKINF